MSLLTLAADPKTGCSTQDSDFDDELCHLQCWCTKDAAMCGSLLDTVDDHTAVDGQDCSCLKCVVCYELNQTGCPNCGR